MKRRELAELTDRQAQVLETAIRLQQPDGDPFWIEPLAEIENVSPEAMLGMVNRLIRAGYVEPAKAKGRGGYHVLFDRNRRELRRRTIRVAPALSKEARSLLELIVRGDVISNEHVIDSALALAELQSAGYVHGEPGGRGFTILKSLDGQPLPAGRDKSSKPPVPEVPSSIVLTLAPADAEATRVPVLGAVAAGQPIEELDHRHHVMIAAELCGRHPCYALVVRGDSMAGDSIANGDILIVRAQSQIERGAIHVCWIPGIGATVKRVETAHDVALLVASNREYEPIQAPEGTIIQGRVVQVLRNLERRTGKR